MVGKMNAMTSLLEYFTPVGQARALEAYSVFAGSSAWSVAQKMDLYQAGRTAFSQASESIQAFEAFGKIYDNLARYWQVFRPQGVNKCWTPRQTFDTIGSTFRDFHPEGQVTLLSIDNVDARQTLQNSLLAMREIKPKASYPTMTVSKFLHFFNPRLFPIYDTEVIGNRVFRVFDADYRSFCAENGWSSTASGPAFLMNYMYWAKMLLAGAGPQFMPAFVNWLSDELPRKRFEALDRTYLSHLYATAFEFTIIGAAVAEDS